MRATRVQFINRRRRPPTEMMTTTNVQKLLESRRRNSSSSTGVFLSPFLFFLKIYINIFRFFFRFSSFTVIFPSFSRPALLLFQRSIAQQLNYIDPFRVSTGRRDPRLLLLRNKPKMNNKNSTYRR